MSVGSVTNMRYVLGVKIELLGTNRAERRGPQHGIIMLKSITSVNNWYLMRKRQVLKLHLTTQYYHSVPSAYHLKGRIQTPSAVLKQLVMLGTSL